MYILLTTFKIFKLNLLLYDLFSIKDSTPWDRKLNIHCTGNYIRHKIDLISMYNKI
jgi:hypothetical protein